MGFSAKPEAFDYTIQNHAEAVDALLSHLGVSCVTVVAHDLGVRVAQEMLARREEQAGLPRIESLVLLNGALCAEAYCPRPIQRLLASPLGAWLGPRIPRRSFNSALRTLFGVATQPSEALLEDFWTLVELGGGRRVTHAVGRFWLPRLAMRDRLVGALQRSPAPLLLINGAADPNSGQHMVARWLELQPNTELVSLPAIGHWPHIEAPEETSQFILKHLNAG